MTQQELADRVGVTRQTIHSIEKGRYNPSVGLALLLTAVNWGFLTLQDGETGT